MNPFLRQPSAFGRTPLRAERPNPKTSEGGVVTLRLYDPLDSWGGEWGVSAKEFVTVLDELPDDTTEIRLLINSPGGEVWEGLAILNALRAHPAKVVAVVEGIAASSASFIAAGVDELHVMQNAEVFVHNAWGVAIGSAVDLEKLAADLTHEDRNLASIYADKAGGSVEDWLAVMAADTTFSAEEAVEAGLADKVVKPPKGGGDATGKAKARFDLSVFARAAPPAAEPARTDRRQPNAAEVDVPEPPNDPTHTPSTGTPPVDPPATPPVAPPAPVSAPETPAAEPVNPPIQEDQMALSTDVLQRLGLADGADNDAVNAAVLAALDAKPTTDPEDDDEDDDAAEPNAAQKELVNASAQYATELKRLSTELAEIKAAKAADVKASVLDTAQGQGKFTPAERVKWEQRYDQAPAVTTDILASLAAGTAVPIAAAGFTGAGEETPDLDAEFAGFFPPATFADTTKGA